MSFTLFFGFLMMVPVAKILSKTYLKAREMELQNGGASPRTDEVSTELLAELKRLHGTIDELKARVAHLEGEHNSVGYNHAKAQEPAYIEHEKGANSHAY